MCGALIRKPQSHQCAAGGADQALIRSVNSPNTIFDACHVVHVGHWPLTMRWLLILVVVTHRSVSQQATPQQRLQPASHAYSLVYPHAENNLSTHWFFTAWEKTKWAQRAVVMLSLQRRRHTCRSAPSGCFQTHSGCCSTRLSCVLAMTRTTGSDASMHTAASVRAGGTQASTRRCSARRREWCGHATTPPHPQYTHAHMRTQSLLCQAPFGLCIDR